MGFGDFNALFPIFRYVYIHIHTHVFAFFLREPCHFFWPCLLFTSFLPLSFFFLTPMSNFSLWNLFRHSTNHLRLRQHWRKKHSHLYSIEGHEKGGGWEQCGELQAGQLGNNCRSLYTFESLRSEILEGDHYWEEWHGSRSDFAEPELASLVLNLVLLSWPPAYTRTAVVCSSSEPIVEDEDW